jgi:hypothetical protein
MVVVNPPLTASVGAVDTNVDVTVLSVTWDTEGCKTVSVTVVTGNFLVMLSIVAGIGLCIDQ